ncbi:MAG: hypothetical protein LBQ86_05865 [Holophagales bacterium]|jgi:hypothetical protein|nr:hypothetical protein [Holophagales bacterium]
MLLSAAFFLLQALQPPPPAQQTQQTPQGDELRIVAVEQRGKPPYKPEEGRVYRLEGNALSRVNPGALLVVKRPGYYRDLGLLRVISIREAVTALATLEVKGETFPLKGDIVLPLSSMGLPEIPADGAAIKDSPPFPLNPLAIPGIPVTDINEAKDVQTPFSPRPLREIIAAQSADGYIRHFVNRPKFLEQNPIYFFKDSAEVSQKGLENLESWIQAWGKTGLNYFLAVPHNQMLLEKITVERLARLKMELQRYGIADVGFRTNVMNNNTPYDAIYVGVEGSD